MAHKPPYSQTVQESLKCELLGHFLPAAARGVRWPLFVRDSHPTSGEIRRLLGEAGIIGLGFGAKFSNKGFTGGVGLCVFVEKKKPLSSLSRRHRVPRRVGAFDTDVISVGRVRHHDRPVALGASISRATGGGGSLGCVVQKPNDPAKYVLSAAHVLAADAAAQKGDVIVSPSAKQNGTPLAVLEDFEALRYDGAANLIDAAIARLNSPADVIPEIPFAGKLNPALISPTVFQSVKKHGATTAHTLGIVTQVGVDIRVFNSSGDRIMYKDVCVVLGAGGGFSKGGDSGALVVDAASNCAVGLLVGGDSEYHSYVIPIGRVLSRFGASLVV